MQKRLAKEARDQEKQAKAIAAGKKVKESLARSGSRRGDTSFFKVTCKVLTPKQAINTSNILHAQCFVL